MCLKHVRVFCVEMLLTIAILLKTLAAKINDAKQRLKEIQAGTRVNESRSELLENEQFHQDDANHAGDQIDANNSEKNETKEELISAKPPSSICKIPAGKNMIIPPADKQNIIKNLFENAKFEDVEKMAGELRNTMGKKCHLPWLIHYMVNSRISNEPDRHDTYLKLIDYLDSKLFDEMMVSNTIENIRIMLKTKDRYQIFAMQQLSNWLSLITVSERRARFVGANNLTKIQFEVKKCIENLLSGKVRKFAKKNRYQSRTFYRSSMGMQHTTELR